MCRLGLTLWSFRQSAEFSRLHDTPSNQPSPACLMTRSQSSSVIPMEKLVEMNVILEMGISVKLGITTVHCSSTMFVSGEDMDKTMLNFFCRAGEGHVVSASCRTFDSETIAVILVESLERLDEQKIDGEPDGASPVGVTTKHAGARIAWPVANTKFVAIDVHREGVIMVIE